MIVEILILMLLDVLAVVFSSETNGAFLVYFLSGKDCSGNLHVASKLTDECIDIVASGVSYHYRCNTSPKNVSVVVYRTLGCKGSILYSTHLGETGKCEKGISTFQKYYCIGEYQPKAPFLKFGFGYHLNRSDIGSSSNPIIGDDYVPVTSKCVEIPQSKYHMKTTCDEKTEEGEVKMFKTGLCAIPIKKAKLKVGQIVDFGQYVVEKPKPKKYLKYLGCKH